MQRAGGGATGRERGGRGGVCRPWLRLGESEVAQVGQRRREEEEGFRSGRLKVILCRGKGQRAAFWLRLQVSLQHGSESSPHLRCSTAKGFGGCHASNNTWPLTTVGGLDGACSTKKDKRPKRERGKREGCEDINVNNENDK